MRGKDEIRAEIKEKRKEFVEGDADRFHRESELICREIETMDAFRDARTLLSYSPMKGEVDVSMLDCKGKKVLLADCDWNEIPAEEIDFAIIPGVAFAPAAGGKAFHRLGRGGGYYDRLIPLLHCRTIAPAFDFQLFNEIPFDSWDCTVDGLAILDKTFG